MRNEETQKTAISQNKAEPKEEFSEIDDFEILEHFLVLKLDIERLNFNSKYFVFQSKQIKKRVLFSQ